MHTLPITPQAGALALACTALRRHRVALDALRDRAEAELVEHARARRDMERLIARLIDQLDAEDGDVDLEGLHNGRWSGNLDDDYDVVDHPHTDDVDDELTANETAGRGFFLNMGPRADDAEDGADDERDDAERGLGDEDAVWLWMQEGRELGVVR